MRTTMLLALAALALPVSTTRPTDACGGYQSSPSLLVTKAHSDDTLPSDTVRTFVDVGPAGDLATGVQWRKLDKMSFDDTAIAPLKRRSDVPRTVTIIGTAGVRVVTSRAHWLLRPAFRRGVPRLVIEVDAAGLDPQLAVVGGYPDARWEQPVYVEATEEQRRWMAGRTTLAAKPDAYISVHQLGDLEVLSTTSGDERITIVRRGKAEVLRDSRYARGALTLDGRRMLVVQKTDDTLDTIRL